MEKISFEKRGNSMIRRLTAEDHQQVYSFLRQDPSFNSHCRR
ncbi:Acetyltransferase [Geobacillus stearothermophilus]|uniref:Acetyltransferase n=1 Tax=Geobacillus stearothermophilus TaxID=1422 RepID=A0ABQ7HH41_GEOSE|nr:Acetyltransferase [Geobacillus stearothermophilus]OAO85463.1 Acetyltransferase [Geobacillus stearothermophilus]